ncbi:MAG: nitroreductase family protein, partial [Candidatus Muiribacteriaceae bacterium]
EEKIENMLLAGMAAPSAKGTEPWHFFVIRNRQILDKIPDVHPYSKMVKDAPMAILVCYDLEIDGAKDWFEQDLAACCENILIAAHSLGLGAVWLGVHPRKDRVDGLKKLLGFTDDFLPFALIPVGYPDEEKPQKDEYRSDKVGFID